jgi:hypothetical protein
MLSLLDRIPNFDTHDFTPTVPSSYDGFLPYTYTVGARYISLTTSRKDYLIRGWIPLWCQALILFAIYSADPPIVDHETRFGLVPFAPHLPLVFRPFNPKVDEVVMPLLDWYERLAMDDEPVAHPVYCAIPQDSALVITALGNAWAAAEGYSLD